MRIESYLQRSALRNPRKTALVCGRRRLSYADLDALSESLAQGLRAGGLRRGDRVVVFLPNCVEAAAAVFAVLKAGAALVMLNHSTKAEKLAWVLNDSRAAAIILPSTKLDMLRSPGDELPHLRLAVTTGRVGKASEQAAAVTVAARVGNISRVAFERIIDPSAEGLEDADRAATTGRNADSTQDSQDPQDDLAAIIYTSGSSGRPKGVMLSHANVSAAVDSIAAYLRNSESDVILNVLSLSFGYGLTQLLTAAKVGATLVLEASFTYPHAVLKRFAEERVTGFAMVPTIAAMLLQMDLDKYDFRSLRYLTNAGAALPVAHVAALRNVLPKTQLYLMYGQTECLRASYLPPQMVDARPESVGRGMPGVEVYVVDVDGSRVPPGSVGELVVRGENVMQGYWEMPQETAAALRRDDQGRKVLYTGDLFTADAEGFLRFVARKDDIIKTRGEKVSPKEVEDVLHRHPDVAEAVAFGAPDEILGQAVHAAVVVRDGCSLRERDVLRFCSQHLEDFMVPQRVTFHDSLPKTPNAKVNKQELMGVVRSCQ